MTTGPRHHSRWTMPVLRVGAHRFLASIVVMAADVVIVLNARDDTWTLDRLRGRTNRA